ncbi:class I SAM-dependent methyltransferase [Paenibacillus thalictri]|uniref:Class I SAM-dependent methyltransferase n=1 Tax=Paenibacillus thalictri TaxID=2527873 RepID=A0A4Q9DH78_9BACL|nr:class I SAM-dependent methyltransferase [Paenibacillus thalictri]TBL71189.1 class I SAM-dependent methyltransferase [Paenibacillus thalictri]
MEEKNEPDHKRIYEEQENEYEQLVEREDVGPLLKAIRPLAEWQGKTAAELGAGTGRLSRHIAPWVSSLAILDGAEPMLELAKRKLSEAGVHNVSAAVADHRELPLPAESADIVLAGWTLCYIASSNRADWREQLSRAMEELNRVLRQDGVAIIIETMGTGVAAPQPPAFLQPYYRELEQHYGFRHMWVRSDFRFASADEAERLTRFFFGQDLADLVRAERLTFVPSYTGIWWRCKSC